MHVQRARNIPRRTMQPIRRIVALSETEELSKETALPQVLQIVERANPRTCAECGDVFFWKRASSVFCSEVCKKRAKRRRDDPAVGSLERSLNRLDAFDEMRRLKYEDRDDVVPGAVQGGYYNDSGDVRPDDRVPKVKARPSAYGFRSSLRCVECGGRRACSCGALRRKLPEWDSGMSARRVEKHTGWSGGPPGLTFDRFWIAAQFGARLIGEERKNERPLGEKALRRKIERHVRHEQESKLLAAQTEADSRLRRMEAQLERVERQNDEIQRQNSEILIRLGDEAAISREVDAFLATAAGDGCGVRAFAD